MQSICTDSSVSGSRFRANASPSLAHLVRGAAEDVPHPTKPGLSLWDATKDSGVFGGEVKSEILEMYEAEMQQADDLGVTPLGSGSDYTVFLQRIGVRFSCAIGHGKVLMKGFRLLVPTVVSVVPRTILLTTTIPYMIPSDGKSCTAILDSSVMCVLLVLRAHSARRAVSDVRLGRCRQTPWSYDFASFGFHRIALEHDSLCSRTG